MAYAGKEIRSPSTRLVFRKTAADTDGELLRFEQFVRGGTPEVPEHLHPRQRERFVVLAGQMGARAAGREVVLGPGEELTIPPGTPHTFWNAGDDELHHVVELRPALDSETFFETVFGLQRDGRLPAEGDARVPNVLQGALLVTAYGNYLARPPVALQKALFPPLALLGRLLGLRASYPRYSDDGRRGS